MLADKIRIPELKSEVLPRPRLVARLCDGLLEGERFGRRLSLVSAPAGFGKTTLAATWLRSCLRLEPRLGAAWLSLDEGDADPASFMRYLRAALRAAAPALAEPTNAGLAPGQAPGGEAAMTALLNEFAEIDERILLVLDDYHAAEGAEVDRLVALLAEHLPPRLHLAIFTRAEPVLPLPRLRARGQLAELRAADLRFDAAEAADFLGRSMKINLSEGDLAALELRTEGWAAGLQLAALALRGRSDPSVFIASFAGSHRFVLDYLVEEVLGRATEEIRDFLLRTSILDRFCVPLCEALAGGDGRAALDALERANLFLVPLDDRREWYRYHHLFSDVLRARLAAERPDEGRGLHARASDWLAGAGFPEDAIRHALAAADFERAADLIELRRLAMDGEARSAAWLGLAKRLPEAAIRARPVLSAGYGWALLDTGELEASEAWFRDAENPPAGFLVADEEEYRSMPASIAVARAYRSLALGDIPGTLAQAGRAVELAPEGDHHRRMTAAALLGLARYSEGDLAAAEEAIASAMSIARGAGVLSVSLTMTFLLADIWIALGRLRDAERAYEDSLRLAADGGEEFLNVSAELHRGMSEILLERGDLDAAAEELRIARDLGESATLTDWRYRANIAEARIAEAAGDLEAALDFLGEAERFHIRTPLPDLRPVDAIRARIWVRQGESAKALAWARGRGLSADGELGFLEEFGNSTLARALVARYGEDREGDTIESAARLLGRLLEAAEAGGRRGSAIELHATLALAREARGDLRSALESLERAVELAEPEGYARAFLGEGPRMETLLKRLHAKTAAPLTRAYLGRILAAAAGRSTASAPPAARGAKSLPPREPLSERELEVLALLRGDLSGPEIASELYISLNTFRTHTKNIFDKLDVNSRRAAVRRAESLGLA